MENWRFKNDLRIRFNGGSTAVRGLLAFLSGLAVSRLTKTLRPRTDPRLSKASGKGVYLAGVIVAACTPTKSSSRTARSTRKSREGLWEHALACFVKTMQPITNIRTIPKRFHHRLRSWKAITIKRNQRDLARRHQPTGQTQNLSDVRLLYRHHPAQGASRGPEFTKSTIRRRAVPTSPEIFYKPINGLQQIAGEFRSASRRLEEHAL